MIVINIDCHLSSIYRCTIIIYQDLWGLPTGGFSSKISKIKKWYVSSKIYMGNSPANTGGDNEFVKIIVTPFWGTQFLDKPICWFKNALGQWNILRPLISRHGWNTQKSPLLASKLLVWKGNLVVSNDLNIWDDLF